MLTAVPEEQILMRNPPTGKRSMAAGPDRRLACTRVVPHQVSSMALLFCRPTMTRTEVRWDTLKVLDLELAARIVGIFSYRLLGAFICMCSVHGCSGSVQE